MSVCSSSKTVHHRLKLGTTKTMPWAVIFELKTTTNQIKAAKKMRTIYFCVCMFCVYLHLDEAHSGPLTEWMQKGTKMKGINETFPVFITLSIISMAKYKHLWRLFIFFSFFSVISHQLIYFSTRLRICMCIMVKVVNSKDFHPPIKKVEKFFFNTHIAYTHPHSIQLSTLFVNNNGKFIFLLNSQELFN